ncbi:MAG: hypothetical protein R3D05_02085 [Dongiaceae bacterium]
MEQVVLVMARLNGKWRAYVRDFPDIQAEGTSASETYRRAVRAVRGEIHKRWAAGLPLPKFHTYAEIRIDEAWLRQCGIRWCSAIVRTVGLPPRLQALPHSDVRVQGASGKMPLPTAPAFCVHPNAKAS